MADEEKNNNASDELVVDTTEVSEEQPTEKPNNTVEKEEAEQIPDEAVDNNSDIKPENVDLDNPEEVSNALNKKGVDYNSLAEEYLNNGKLSEKSMAELEAAGIPPEMVNDYIKGYEARAELERNELAECVGGREEMENIITWASNNLKKEEIYALNAIRNKFELESVLIGLKTRMEEKEGKIPKYQKGTGDKTVVTGFRSKAEMAEAIRNPKYKIDEAYRADVRKKIAASREAGVDIGINNKGDWN